MSPSGRSVHSALEQRIEALQAQITPALVESTMDALLREGEDPGGGIGAFRLVAHLLTDSGLADTEVVYAYERLRPALRAALEALPAFYFFEGD
jgi:hypothetical protein